MKILIVTQYFWPENFKINDLAVDLVEKGHDVTVLTSIPNYPKGSFFDGYGLLKKRKESYFGVKVIRSWIIPRGNGKTIKIIYNYVSALVFSSLAIIFKVRGSFDVQFVFANSPLTVALPAIFKKKLKKIPIVLWLQDIWPESVYAMVNLNSKITRNFIDKISMYIYNKSDVILAQSLGYEALLEKKGISKKKIEYLPNWADQILVDEASSKKRKSEIKRLLPRGFKIIFTGNIGEAQDFPSLLNAVELLKQKKVNIKWVIVGAGGKHEWLKLEVVKRGLDNNMFLLGSFPLADMPHFFNMADVLYVSLKKDPAFTLTVPGKVQMYLNAGKPILSMIDGEGHKVIKSAKVGFSVSAGEFTELAKRAEELSNMTKVQLQKLGDNALRYSQKNYNRRKILDNTEKILSRLSKND